MQKQRSLQRKLLNLQSISRWAILWEFKFNSNARSLGTLVPSSSHVEENGTLKETEINFQDFFVEWWRYIAQHGIFSNIAEGMQEYILLRDKSEVVDNLMSFRSTKAGKFFSVLYSVEKFTDKSDRTILDNKYKMYVEIKYNANVLIV